MILIDASPLQSEHRYRGPGAYTAGLLEALTRLPSPDDVGWGLLAQTAHDDDLPLLAALRERTNVMTVPLHRPRRPRYRATWQLSTLAVGEALRRSRPRLYHATEAQGLVVRRGVRTVATLHDLIPLHAPEVHFPLRRLDQRLGYAAYLRRLHDVDAIVAPSAATRHDAVERLRLDERKIVVIAESVDETLFTPRPLLEIEAMIVRHGLRRPYFLHVGASTYQKNTRAVLKAFDLFASGAGGAEHALYITGKWTPQALAALTHDYATLVRKGRLRVLGFVPEDVLPALYSGADALVYPSLIEGFGLPVLEAMRCGTAVLTSNRSSLPEVGGAAALYVDPREADAIADGMLRLATDVTLRADLARRGLVQAVTFSWDRAARETIRVYEALL